MCLNYHNKINDVGSQIKIIKIRINFVMERNYFIKINKSKYIYNIFRKY